MVSQETFNGVVAGMTIQMAFFNTVAARLGIDETLTLLKETCNALGGMQGQMAKQQAGPQQIDAAAALPLSAKGVFDPFGVTYEVVKSSPDEVVTRMTGCPIYAAGLMLGLDHKAIEGFCRNGSLNFNNSFVKNLNRDLTFELRKFRASPDDFCEEAICKG